MRVEINVVTPAVAVSLLYSASSMVATLRPYLPLRRHPHRFLRRPLAHVIRRSQPGPRPRPRMLHPPHKAPAEVQDLAPLLARLGDGVRPCAEFQPLGELLAALGLQHAHAHLHPRGPLRRRLPLPP